MGIGSARGDDRSVAAAEMAISSPLLEASIDGAHGVLLSIQGGSDLGLFEINEAAQLVSNSAAPDANIIFGAVIDDALGDEVRVTVIAAGFDEADARPGQVEPGRRPASAGTAGGTRAVAGGSPGPAAATRRPRRRPGTEAGAGSAAAARRRRPAAKPGLPAVDLKIAAAGTRPRRPGRTRTPARAAPAGADRRQGWRR